VAQVFRNSHLFWEAASGRPRVRRRSCASTCSAASPAHGELAHRRWLAGDDFSIADITAVCALDFGKVSAIRITDETPHLARWYADIKTRPSYKA
jgi:glutathione S-transferase